MILAENDRPDGLFIIHLGMVKVIKNASPLLGRGDIVAWTGFEASLRAGAEESAGVRHRLWKQIPPQLWEKLDEWKQSLTTAEKADLSLTNVLWSKEQQEILYALNDLLKLKNFHELIKFDFDASNPRLALMQKESKALKDGKSFEEVVSLRGFNRRLLEFLLDDSLREFGVTPPRTLAILSSDEWASAQLNPSAPMAKSSLIGEAGLFKNIPRNATCVAYGHPDSKFSRTDLYFIPKELFADLVDPEYIERILADRDASGKSRMEHSIWQEDANARRFEELGLIQGQKLMLIDLDRCTRCDKCVEACVASHSPPGPIGRLFEGCLEHDWNPFRNTGPRDGRSRLFLDGPRIAVQEGSNTKNYLVPSTCRQCKDPVCLFGCPVGSIHPGANGQIVIEDWCIGCTKCSINCPYNSIQMHSIGVLPRSAEGWKHGQGARPMMAGAMPFRHNAEFLAEHPTTEPVRFERSFELTRKDTEKSKAFLLHIETTATEVSGMLNSRPIEVRKLEDAEVKKKGWQWEAMLARTGEDPLPAKQANAQRQLQSGENHISLEISVGEASYDEVLLDVGLTGYVEPVVDPSIAGEVEQEWVTQRAVVCDMCSGQLGKKPACVTACPHEAADRKPITYETFFPVESFQRSKK